MKNFRFKKQKSFTLVEMLTVVFLSLVIVVASYSLYVMSYRSYQHNSASAELTQNARIALERFSRDVRQAIEILNNLPEDPSETTPPSEIKFQDGHNFWPPANGKIQYITYYLSGTDLYRKISHYAFPTSPDDWVLWSTLDDSGQPPTEYTDLDQIKAQNISQLRFWGKNIITVRMSVSDGSSTYTFETKATARNIQ